jgi:hypothetical protein
MDTRSRKAPESEILKRTSIRSFNSEPMEETNSDSKL